MEKVLLVILAQTIYLVQELKRNNDKINKNNIYKAKIYSKSWANLKNKMINKQRKLKA